MPLARFNADVVVLTEWQGARDHIDSYAWREDHDVAGGQSDAYVVTRGEVVDRELHDMAEHWWWGPHRWKLRRRAPRTYIEELADVDGQRLPVLGVHLPPGGPNGARFRTGGKNKAAWHESARFVQRWLNDHPDGVVVGDLNATAAEIRTHITRRYTNTGKVDGAAWGSDLAYRTTQKISRVPGHGAGVITLQEKP